MENSDVHIISINNIGDMEWNESNENTCRGLSKRSKAFSWIYAETSRYYNKINTAFTLIIVIGNFLLGSSGIPTIFTQNFYDTRYINLILQISVIFLGMVGIVYKILNISDRIVKANLISYRYSSLYVDIKRELSKIREKRISYDIFYEKISKEELDLKQNFVSIPNKIIKDYRKKFLEKAVKYEDLFDGSEDSMSRKSREIESVNDNDSRISKQTNISKSNIKNLKELKKSDIKQILESNHV